MCTAIEYNHLEILEYLILNCDDVDAFGHATRKCVELQNEAAFEILEKHKKLCAFPRFRWIDMKDIRFLRQPCQ